MNYFDGLRAGVRRFAWWKDGLQYVGTTGTTLSKAIEDITTEEENYYPESTNPQISDKNCHISAK